MSLNLIMVHHKFDRKMPNFELSVLQNRSWHVLIWILIIYFLRDSPPNVIVIDGLIKRSSSDWVLVEVPPKYFSQPLIFSWDVIIVGHFLYLLSITLKKQSTSFSVGTCCNPRSSIINTLILFNLPSNFCLSSNFKETNSSIRSLNLIDWTL